MLQRLPNTSVRSRQRSRHRTHHAYHPDLTFMGSCSPISWSASAATSPLELARKVHSASDAARRRGNTRVPPAAHSRPHDCTMEEEATAHHALASPTALASSAACNSTDKCAILISVSRHSRRSRRDLVQDRLTRVEVW